MPRTISPGLKSSFVGSTLTIATCVKITRQDGTILGFTSLDQSFVFETVTYEALSSSTVNAIKSAADTGVDNTEIIGILNSTRIADDDIRAGLYDYATVLVFQVNYSSLADGKLILLRAVIGDIEMSDGSYRAELRSQSQQLKQYIGDVTTPTCRVKRLFDNQCKATLIRITETVQNDNRGPGYLLISNAGNKAAGYYDYGVVIYGNYEREIKTTTIVGSTIQIYLRIPFPYDRYPTNETSVVLEPGCNRTLTMCKNKFNNVINFHGEPHLPGNDAILQIGRAP